MILVGLLVTGLGAALRFGEVASTAGVSTHQVGTALFVAGVLEFGLALWLRLKSPARPVQPVLIQETAHEHNEGRAA